MDENRVLVLGATGMLGNALYRYLHSLPDIEVYGTTELTILNFFHYQ